MDERSTIFVVDDDLSVRRALARLLQSAGFFVETYASGLEFLDASASPKQGCLVLDVRMPHMSGFDVMASLRACGNALPVVLVTGDCDSSTAVRARNAGCSAFLTKPFEENLLLDAVRDALRDRSLCPDSH